MKLSVATKSAITRIINSTGNGSSGKTSEIARLVEQDLEPQMGYEPDAVEAMMNALLDAMLDKRKAINFGGHSIPESIGDRIRKAVEDGKITIEVRY